MQVDLVTNIAPHYRERLWLLLLADSNFSMQIAFGKNPKSSIRTINFSQAKWSPYLHRLNKLGNVYFRGILVWQRTVIGSVLATRASTCVLLGDMFVLSTWLAALVLRMRGIPVVFWGHGLYGNESFLRRKIRLAFLRLANVNLVYGSRARALLLDAGFAGDRVRVVYNSLDYVQQVALRRTSLDVEFYRRSDLFSDATLPVLVFIGRLTPQKRLDQLVDAVRDLNHRAPRYNLVFVGDGPEKPLLEARSEVISEHVAFVGACYEESEIARLHCERRPLRSAGRSRA